MDATELQRLIDAIRPHATSISIINIELKNGHHVNHVVKEQTPAIKPRADNAPQPKTGDAGDDDEIESADVVLELASVGIHAPHVVENLIESYTKKEILTVITRVKGMKRIGNPGGYVIRWLARGVQL